MELPGQVGQVFLGYMDPASGEFVNYFGAHIQDSAEIAILKASVEQPLASNVVLDNKAVDVIVPDLPTGDFYYIICEVYLHPHDQPQHV